MPTPKQMEKLAAEAARKPETTISAQDGALPEECWDSVLGDARASSDGSRLRRHRLSDIGRHVVRVACRRCARAVEIQTVDAVRLYGSDATWKKVAQRLLDDTCQQRTGRYEEDGCWPSFTAIAKINATRFSIRFGCRNASEAGPSALFWTKAGCRGRLARCFRDSNPQDDSLRCIRGRRPERLCCCRPLCEIGAPLS